MDELPGPAGGGAGGRPVLRFAPSPTGQMHLGTAFSALFTYETARALGGRFVLRIEDIDQARSRPQFTTALIDDLAWLGLEWEEPIRHQSAHMGDYHAVIEDLAGRGLLFACYASRSELAAVAATNGGEWPRDPDGTPLHPGPGQALAPIVEQARRAAGAAAALRLDMARALGETAARDIAFDEFGAWAPQIGRTRADPGRWGDVVIGRKDSATSYHLSVVVDDALQGVTHVTRGMDLYEATHLHCLLQALLGLPSPAYCHHPLMLDAGGRKLGKSTAAASIASLRAAGATPGDVRAATGIDDHRDFFAALASAPPPPR